MELSSGSDRPSAESSPPARRSVPQGRVQRIAGHTQDLVTDLTEWVELRIELARIEIEERIEAQANKIVLGIMLASIGLLAVVFGLVTLALGIGAWLGHPAWGFLVVTGLLAVLLIVLRAARPVLVDIDLSRKPSKRPAGEQEGSATSTE